MISGPHGLIYEEHIHFVNDSQFIVVDVTSNSLDFFGDMSIIGWFNTSQNADNFASYIQVCLFVHWILFLSVQEVSERLHTILGEIHLFDIFMSWSVTYLRAAERGRVGGGEDLTVCV